MFIPVWIRNKRVKRVLWAMQIKNTGDVGKCWGSCPWKMHDFEAQMLCWWPQLPVFSACFLSLIWVWEGRAVAYLCSFYNPFSWLPGHLLQPFCGCPRRHLVFSWSVSDVAINSNRWAQVVSGNGILAGRCCLSPRLQISFELYLCFLL